MRLLVSCFPSRRLSTEQTKDRREVSRKAHPIDTKSICVCFVCLRVLKATPKCTRVSGASENIGYRNKINRSVFEKHMSWFVWGAFVLWRRRRMHSAAAAKAHKSGVSRVPHSVTESRALRFRKRSSHVRQLFIFLIVGLFVKLFEWGMCGNFFLQEFKI